MRVGIFLHEALRSLLEFFDCLIRKFIQLLLERVALVRGRLLQINLRLLLLIDERVACRKVRFAPWSLTARITTSAHGFPFTSKIVPLIDPVWAPARGASRHSSAATRIAASAPD